MLRAIVGLAAIVFLGVALVAVVIDPMAWPALLGALLIAAGCLFERRYHDRLAGLAPGSRFRPTGERFVDPETGRPTIVWIDPATGERRYLPDDEARAPVV